MISKVLSYGLVGLLAVALLGGTGYILFNPSETEAIGQGQDREGIEIGQRGQGGADNSVTYGQGQRGQGQGRGSGSDEASGQGISGNTGSGAGQVQNGTTRTLEWETVTGTVLAIDGEVTVETAAGEMLVGMGQSAYWESFELGLGDEIRVTGFYEDGEFKAGTVENLTSGGTITLRDDSGRPMWSGRGRSGWYSQTFKEP